MKKEVCFKIDGQELFAEKTLVDYNDMPIFFLCKSGTQYYLVLCTDVHEMSYVIVRLSLVEVYNLLHGEKPMRSFIQRKDFWKVVSGDEVSSDVVTHHSACELDESVLPEEGACFNILTEDMETYVSEFDEGFFLPEEFVSTNLSTALQEAEDFCGIEVDRGNYIILLESSSEDLLLNLHTSFINFNKVDWKKMYIFRKEMAGFSECYNTKTWRGVSSNPAA